MKLLKMKKVFQINERKTFGTEIEISTYSKVMFVLLLDKLHKP